MKGATGRDDATFLRRLRKREPRAVERWFLDNADSLYTFVFYRVGGDTALAADVVQDTFTAALEKIRLYEPGRGPMLAWLTWTARNCIRRALKHKRRYEQQMARWNEIDRDLVSAWERLATEPLSDEVLEREETAELVRMALANTPARYRVVLERRYCRQEDLERIASAEGLTPAAVKSLLHRARLAFKIAFLTIAESRFAAVPRTGGNHDGSS